jgi:hypothetical protein
MCLVARLMLLGEQPVNAAELYKGTVGAHCDCNGMWKYTGQSLLLKVAHL